MAVQLEAVLAVQRALDVRALVAARLTPHAALHLAVIRLHLVVAHAVAFERTASLEAVALRALRLFAHRGWILDRKSRDRGIHIGPPIASSRGTRCCCHYYPGEPVFDKTACVVLMC
jgi:hypothetical protein